ncbi:gp53-like domain-containing protein [Burkholderia cenocepacia]|uniref:gp53-like domain-containing protein n=1 Tax=Burkholderia cenocepacia TaxID=95486 RepID=UPI003F73B72B
MWESAGSRKLCNAIGCAEYLADGTMFQWGEATCPTQIVGVVYNFPFGFPHGANAVLASLGYEIGATQPATVGAQPISNSQFAATCAATTPGTDGFWWFATGS